MAVNLRDAIPKSAQGGNNQFVSVKSPAGVYKAKYVGLTSPYAAYNRFKACEKCHGNGAACNVCDSTGETKEMRTNIRYRLQDGTIEEEAVTFKLFPGGRTKDGRVLSSSKLYDRLSELSGLLDADQIAVWAEAEREVPCEVRIKVKPGSTYPKIVDVNRTGPPSAAPQADPDDDPDLNEIPF